MLLPHRREIRDREKTIAPASRHQHACLAGTAGCQNVPAGADRYDPDLIQSWQGDPETQDFVVMLNSEIPVSRRPV